MRRYYETARVVLERHGGTVEKFVGDAVMAVFGVPVAHEDDALRAVRAAVELREALAPIDAELQARRGVGLRTRTGLNTGEVVTGQAGTGETLVTGDTVNVAARLEQAAAPGEILLGDTTWRLARGAVEAESVDALTLKGKSAPVRAVRLIALVAGDGSRAASPLVGRDFELTLLRQAFERVRDSGICHQFTLLGPAGIGKSRLAHEAIAAVADEAHVLRGRCLAYGEGITFWPLTEMVRQVAGIAADDGPDAAYGRLRQALDGHQEADAVAATVGLATGLRPGQASTEEVFWAFRRFLEWLARERPVVAVVDDLQWAEPTLLDLVESIGEWSREAPLLLVCLARPELLEVRPRWAGGKLNATNLLLEPLSESEADRLLETLLGGVMPRDQLARVRSAAEGNPLFLEEFVAMLVDAGLVARRDGRVAALGDLSALEVPPSIWALLTARLDRLAGPERTLIQAAAVMGKVFPRSALEALVPAEARGDVTALLGSLVRKELIRPDRTGPPTEPTFRFRHQLVRDAAYQALPKQARVELHARYADWLEREAGERLPEQQELVGYHLEQAYRYRQEIGLAITDPSGPRRAAEHLGAAGRRALARSDLPAAISLLERALALLKDDDDQRPAIMAALGSALTESGHYARAEAVFTGAAEAARAAGDSEIEEHTALTRLHVMAALRPEGAAERVQREVERILPHLRERGDDLGLAKAYRQLALVRRTAGRYGAMEQALERAVAHARRAGDEREVSRALALQPVAWLSGPRPLAEVATLLDGLDGSAVESRTVERGLLFGRAAVAALEGRADDARVLGERRLATCLELGLPVDAAETELLLARGDTLAGDVARAAGRLTEARQRLSAIGERLLLPLVEARLAGVLALTGAIEEALEASFRSEESAPGEDVAVQVGWRVARARVLSQLGEAAAAVPIADAAVAQARASDGPLLLGEALLEQALVLRRAGRLDAAATTGEEAQAAFTAKGAVAWSSVAAAWLQAVPAAGAR
ncbi:MAG TPA: AAA family ATPase, partial [Candidatus Limnocylindrales bacterium]|nr:AAA family ATPase [Candidatus Limnocylindrales bacterium]